MQTVSMIGPKGLNDIFRRVECDVINRTGTVLELGDLVAFDMTQGDAASTSISTALENVVVPATANLNFPMAIVSDLLDGSGADDSKVRVVVQGDVQARVAASLSTGDLLMASNGLDSLVALAAQAVPSAARGQLLEDSDASSITNKRILFNGLGALAVTNIGETP